MMGRDMSFDAPIAADLETISRRSQGDFDAISSRSCDETAMSRDATGCGRTCVPAKRRKRCMPSDVPHERLQDIISNIDRVRDHVQGMTQGVELDDKTRDAVVNHHEHARRRCLSVPVWAAPLAESGHSTACNWRAGCSDPSDPAHGRGPC